MKTIRLRDNELAPLNFTGVVILSNGDKFWRKNGKLHREDGPAKEYADGSRSWWLDGSFHREDGPAGIYIGSATNHMKWAINGMALYDNYELDHIKDNYIVVARGIPTDVMFGKLKLTQTKLLTAEGTKFVYDNLPGQDLIQ